jgi:hypothetical protein
VAEVVEALAWFASVSLDVALLLWLLAAMVDGLSKWIALVVV